MSEQDIRSMIKAKREARMEGSPDYSFAKSDMYDDEAIQKGLRDRMRAHKYDSRQSEINERTRDVRQTGDAKFNAYMNPDADLDPSLKGQVNMGRGQWRKASTGFWGRWRDSRQNKKGNKIDRKDAKARSKNNEYWEKHGRSIERGRVDDQTKKEKKDQYARINQRYGTTPEAKKKIKEDAKKKKAQEKYAAKYGEVDWDSKPHY